MAVVVSGELLDGLVDGDSAMLESELQSVLEALRTADIAGVVGLISATTLGLLRTSLTSVTTTVLFGLALAALFKWKTKLVIPIIILSAALVGLAVQAL